MSKKYKIIVPKPCAVDKDGLHVELMKADEIVDANNDVMKANMETFVENGWAIEVKVDAPEETVDVESDVKPKRARNKKGQLKGDDPSTPDYNEAWEDGKAPKKTTKKTTAKKTTKKKSS
tara:strand:- start:236 stop:595 length:360 start_codon:yes stop_codon:yes gene_type:complete